MRYRMRSHFVILWPIIFVANAVLLIVFLVANGHKSENPYSSVVFWVCFYGDIMMAVQYFKQMMFDKYRHLYKFIAVHQREVVDPTLLLLTSVELTQKAQDASKTLEPGADIYARGFLNMQKGVQNKMKYSTEEVISNNS